MRNATELLAQYAEYHRDQRNILSHFVGVPMIVFAVGVLLARPELQTFGIALTPAWVALALGAAWYLTRGEVLLGLSVTLVVGILFQIGHRISDSTGLSAWFAWGAGFFAVGWLIQFVGHVYEGRKPAFIDDIVGLLVGPLFVTAEALFLLGWNRPLLAEIERRAGPTHLRDIARIA